MPRERDLAARGEEFADGAKGLVDRDAGVGASTRVGIGNSNAPEWLATADPGLLALSGVSRPDGV